MEYTRENPPPKSPPCWSRQFDPGTSECKGCSFNLSCEKVSRQPVALQPFAPPPSPNFVPVQQVARPIYPPSPPPPPPQGYYQQQVPTPPVPAPYRPPQYQPQQYQQQAYYPPPFSWTPPPPPVPPPLPPSQPVYTARGHQPAPPVTPQQPPAPPGQPGQEPFHGIFGQYPGEPTHIRLGKNVLLRAFEAIFTELARFFHYWTWPFSRGS